MKLRPCKVTWLMMRLVYVAQGTDGRMHPWGNERDEIAIPEAHHGRELPHSKAADSWMYAVSIKLQGVPAVWRAKECAQRAVRPNLCVSGIAFFLFAVIVLPCARAAMALPQSAPAEKAQNYAERGMDLAQSGDLKSAEEELRRAVALAPNNPEFLAELAGVLGMEQKLEEAGVYFEKALKADPENLQVRRDLAANRWQLGHLQEAKTNLRLILKVKPDDRRSILLLGMVSENLSDYAEAARLLGSVPELVRQRPESVAALARAYYHTNQQQKARATLEKILQDSAEPGSVFMAGEVASQAGDSETALKLFEAIRPSYPDHAVLNYNIALAEYRGGRVAEAESVLVDLRKAGHETVETLNLLGWCYYKQGKYQESVRTMNDAIALDPTRESTYLALCQMLKAHDLPLAHRVAAAAVERLPNSFRLYMIKGLIEARQGDYTQAVVSYRRAVALDANSREANFNLARMQWRVGSEKEAEETFRSGIKRFPRDGPTYVEYSLMLLKGAETGDSAREQHAVALLKQACAVNPSYAEPHYQLGNLALIKGNIADAQKELQTAARLNPKDAKTHFALSRAYRRLGRSQDAAAELALYQKLKAMEENAE
jgi:tetratricopeptide (TPR) repeat protein